MSQKGKNQMSVNTGSFLKTYVGDEQSFEGSGKASSPPILQHSSRASLQSRLNLVVL